MTTPPAIQALVSAIEFIGRAMLVLLLGAVTLTIAAFAVVIELAPAVAAIFIALLLARVAGLL